MMIGQRKPESTRAGTRSRAAACIRVDDLQILPGSRQVFRGETELPVTGHSFDFLIALIDEAPDIATPDRLSERVWDGRPVSPETINQRAKLLRDALSDDSSDPRYFAAVRGQGYRLIASPEWSNSGAAGRRRPPGLLAGALLLVALTVLIGMILFPPDSTDEALVDAWVGQAQDLLHQHSAEGLARAVEDFSEILVREPDAIDALLGLAEARLLQSRYRLIDRPVAERLAADLLERAGYLEPESAGLHAMLGLLAWMRGEPESAEAAFREALRLDPRHAAAHLYYGFLLVEDPALHRPFEAVELWRSGARMNPDSLLLQVHLAWTDWRAGRLDLAEEALLATIQLEPELAPAHFVLGELHLESGRQPKAIVHYRQALALNRFLTPLVHDGLMRALLDLGLDEEADRVLVQLSAMPEGAGWHAALHLAASLERGPPPREVRIAMRDQARTLLAQRPSDAAFVLAMIELIDADPAAARAALEQGEPRLAGELGDLPLDGYWRVLVCPYAFVLTELGDAERGYALASWLLNRIDTGPDLARFAYLDRLLCQVAAGHTEQALGVLREQADHGLPSGWRFLRYRPDLAALQAKPEFQALIRQFEVQSRELSLQFAGHEQKNP